MSPLHLTRDTYQKLLSGELAPGAARELGLHLAEPCETCEGFLAALPPDAADGAVDAALGRLSPERPAARGDDLEYARIERGLGRVRGRVRRGRLWATAALLLAVGGAGLALRLERGGRGPSLTGEKGVALSAPARLRFAVVEPGARTAGVARGRSGEALPRAASLAFRVEVKAPAYVALLRVGGGERDLIWRAHLSRPGTVDVSEEGRPAAYPLQGLTGPQRFVLYSSAAPLGEGELEQGARAPGVAEDEVEITVE